MSDATDFQICKETSLDSIQAQEYSNWETDEVITKELFRNLGIALACVFVTTLILLANLLGSIIVLLCVAITLVIYTMIKDSIPNSP